MTCHVPFAAPIRRWPQKSPAVSWWDAKMTIAPPIPRSAAPALSRPGRNGPGARHRTASAGAKRQLPGTWLRISFAQRSTVWLNPSGKRFSANIRPTVSPISSPMTNLPITAPPQQRATLGGAPTFTLPLDPANWAKSCCNGGSAPRGTKAELAIPGPGVYCSGTFLGPQRAAKGRVSSAVEQRFCKPKVGSSILSPGTIQIARRDGRFE